MLMWLLLLPGLLVLEKFARWFMMIDSFGPERCGPPIDMFTESAMFGEAPRPRFMEDWSLGALGLP